MFIFSNARCISAPGSVDIGTFIPLLAGPRGVSSLGGGTYNVRGLLILVRDEEIEDRYIGG